MIEIVTQAPKKVIHVSEIKLGDGIIIASSMRHGSEYFHPHGIVVQRENKKFNVVTPNGSFQFSDQDTIEKLIRHYVHSGWRFFQFKQGNNPELLK